MSRKDYVALARAFRTILELTKQTEATPRQVALYCAARIADVLQADNPRFNRDRFLAACETGKGL